MKRFSVKAVIIAALAIACTLALAACGGQSSSSSTSSSDTQTKPKIVVGYDKNNFGTEAGQAFTDSAQYVHLIKSAFDELGWDAEFKGIDFADAEKFINDGTIDCFWNCYTIQGREDRLAWSGAYAKAKPVLIYKMASANFGDAAAMADIASIATRPAGMTIAVEEGTVTYGDMPADQKAIIDAIGTFKEYPNLTKCKEALDKGEVDMVFTEMQIMSPLFDDSATYGHVVFEPTLTNTYGVGFKKGNEDKAQAVTEALRTIYSNGTLKNNFVNHWKGLGYDSAKVEGFWKEFEQDWLLKDKIVVGYDKDSFGTGEGQAFTDSFDYCFFIKSTLAELGWDAEFKGIDFADVEKSINDGTIDCFWNGYTIQGREDKFAWSGAYKKARPVILYKTANRDFEGVEGIANIASLASLPSGKTIAMESGTVTYADMSAEEKAVIGSIGTLKEYPNLTKCKEALDNGEVDMVLTEIDFASPLFSDFAVYDRVFFASSDANTYGVAFKKGSEDKAQAVTEAMRKVYTSGTLKSNGFNYLQKLGGTAAGIELAWADFDQDWLLK